MGPIISSKVVNQIEGLYVHSPLYIGSLGGAQCGTNFFGIIVEGFLPMHGLSEPQAHPSQG